LKIALFLGIVLFLFGGPIMAFIRFLGRRSQQPPQRPSPSPRRQRGRKVRASEDIVDAEIIDFRKE
jgi:hypothetical protein